MNGGSNPTAGIGFSVVVQSQDAFGNPSNVTASTGFSLSRATGTGTLGGTLTGTIAAGTSQVTVSGVTYTKAESGVSITATRTSGDNVTVGTSATFTVNAGTATSLSVTGFTSPTTAGASHTFTVTALDSNGNTATGYTGTVHFTSSDGQAVLPANSTLTSGTGTFSATLGTAGSQSITATDTVTGSITGSQSGITVNAAAPTKLAIISVNGGSNPTAGVGFSVVVQSQDPFGNPSGVSPADNLGLTVQSGTPSVLGGTTTGTLSGGNSQVTISNVTYTKAEGGVVLRISKTSGGGPGLTPGDSAPFTVNPGPIDHFIVSAASSATAGSPISVTVTAKDIFDNTKTDYAGTVHFTSTDGAAILPGNYTFLVADAGVHVFASGVTLKTAGSRTVSVNDTVTTTSTGTSGTITVNPGPIDHFVVSAPAATAGSPISVTVTAKDIFNNTKSDYTGTIHFTSTDGAAVLPGNYTFVAGDNGVRAFVAAVTLKTAGSQTVSVNDTLATTSTGSSGNISVVAGPAAGTTTTITAAPTSVSVDIGSSAISVQAKDQYGNNLTSSGGTVVLHTTGRHAQRGHRQRQRHL